MVGNLCAPDLGHKRFGDLLGFIRRYCGNQGDAVRETTAEAPITIDLTPPLLTSVSISSNNDKSTALAKAGDLLSLVIAGSEPLQSVAVKLSEYEAGVQTVDSTNFIATVSACFLGDGVVTLDISYADFAGNTGTATAATDSSSVVVDLTSPSLVRVNIGSSNACPTNAIDSNLITLSFDTSEPISPPTDTVSIVSRSALVTGGAQNWNGQVTIVSTDTEGTVAFSLLFEDLAGNVGALVQKVTDSSFVTVDLTPPQLNTVLMVSNSGVNPQQAKHGDTVSVAIEASEPILQVQTLIASLVAEPSGQGPSGPGNLLGYRSYVASLIVREPPDPCRQYGVGWELCSGVCVVSGCTAATQAEESLGGTRNAIAEDGSASISIQFADVAGIAGEVVVATTDSKYTIIDVTPPTLITVSIESDNEADAAQSNTGDTIYLRFSADEDIRMPDVLIAGHNAISTVDGIVGTSFRCLRCLC